MLRIYTARRTGRASRLRKGRRIGAEKNAFAEVDQEGARVTGASEDIKSSGRHPGGVQSSTSSGHIVAAHRGHPGERVPAIAPGPRGASGGLNDE